MAETNIIKPTPTHVSVMLKEVITALAPKPGGVYVDGTLGSGGYTKAILDAAPCKTISIDRDPEAIRAASILMRDYTNRLHLAEGKFSDMESIVYREGSTLVDGVALDLGISSTQLNDSKRGFSFMRDGPLDMRMGANKLTAADIVNMSSEKELTTIIQKYGEEKRAKKIARNICIERNKTPIQSTSYLAKIIRKSIGPTSSPIDQATRTFQALRIAVNDEIGQLIRGLMAAERLLKTGGRLVVVSFHSLEDREVKSFMKLRSGTFSRGSRHEPISATKIPDPSFKLLFQGVQKPTSREVGANPRARSAKLRAAERTNTPAIKEEAAV